MPLPLAAIPPIVTAVGRFAVPYLVKELGKIGANKFAKTYGNEAFTSLNETLANNTPMVNPEVIPMVNPNFMSKKDEEDKTPTVVSEDETKQPQKQPPEGPDLGTELATEAALQVSKKLSESEQTEKALKPKVEFGPLTETEKQTAKALKEGKSDFYSRAVDAIKNAKQEKFTKGKWESIIQSNSTKDEMDYLGLTEFLKGNESITKKELLKFVEKKDIAPNITVRSIPKDEMNTMYEGYSLGGDTTDTQEHIVFQFGRIPSAKELFLDDENLKDKDITTTAPLFKSEHFDTEYGTNTFAHARTQVGYGDPDKIKKEMDMAKRVAESNKDKSQYADFSDAEYRTNLKIAETLNNTLIIDEIQSDWLQKGQDKGFVSDFDIVPENKLIEYLEKNNIFYKLTKNVEDFSNKEAEINKIEWQQSGPIKPGDAPLVEYLNVGYDKNFIFNKSDKTHYLTTGDNIDPVEYLMREEDKVPDFPIKANRYDAMGEEEKQGLKKFYDEIVFKQLEKIADKYNVKLERIDINDPKEFLPDTMKKLNIDNQIKRAQDDGYTLQILSGEILYELVNNRDLPGHASIYSNEGRGQGVDYIMNTLSNEKQLEDNYYIWTKENISEDIDNLNINRDFKNIVWELPIVPVNDATGGTPTTVLTDYTNYLTNYKPPEGVDLGYPKDAEQLIKMKLPKKLQKERLSKPIKLSKAKTQTDRLFA